jgi:LacI family transcriptional regulator
VITIHDVARLAGVSYATAQRAVRQPELLATETLKRVQAAIDKLEYEPHQLASTLRGGQSKTIGLMIGDILEPIFTKLTRMIGQGVRQKGYSLLLADNEYDSALELQMLKMFYSNRVGGIILRSAYAPSNYDYLKRLQDRGVAIVEIDYIQHKSPFSYVMLDNDKAVFDGISYLYKLGHRRIAYIGKASSKTVPEERHTGFLKAAKHYKLQQDFMGLVANYSVEETYRATQKLLSLKKRPSAIFTANDTCTMGAYKAIQDFGLNIPEDISLLGIDNHNWTTLVKPSLSVFEQPAKEMADAAVKLVFDQIASGDSLGQHVRIPAKFIERGSCKPPKA